MIAIDPIDPPITWHQRDGIFRLESCFVDTPSNRLCRRVRLLCFLVLHKLNLKSLSVIFRTEKIGNDLLPRIAPFHEYFRREGSLQTFH